MRTLASAALLLGAAVTAQPTTCNGPQNNLPIYDAVPTLVAKNANGMKYTASVPNDTAPPLNVIHVYGSQYDMGLAYGSLMKDEITTLIPQVWTYFAQVINSSLPSWVPESMKEGIIKYGVPWALDVTYNATKNFTPAHHYETLQGMADGSGLPYQEIARMSMIPELIKAQCSITVAWGEATINGAAKGQPVHLRALDWNTDGPFQQFPILTTFHPEAGNGLPFSTLGWAGMLGAITGMSSSGMGVGEKVWIQYNGVENIFGYVWTFLLQDILQFDGDLDAAMSRIATANRTCSVWMSLTDANNNAGKVVQYSNQLVNFFNDKNYPAYPNHDLFPQLMFVNKHVQPSTEPCMNDLMHYLYGSIDGPSIIRYVTAMEQTGDMHIGVFDWGNRWMYLANAAPANSAGVAIPAYVRPFMKFDMQALWDTQL